MRLSKLEEALEVLERIQNRTDLICKCKPDEEDGGHDDAAYFNRDIGDHDLYNAISKMEELFFGDDEVTQHIIISWFREHEYYVWPGEQDSFGWLIGCVRKKDGPILIFG